MPVLSVLAAAAHVRDRDHAAQFKPGEVARAHARFLRVAVAAIAVQERGMAAVQREAFAVNDGQRDPRAVVADGKDFLGLIAGSVDGGRRVQACVIRAICRGVVDHHTGRLQPAPDTVQRARLVRVGHRDADVALERCHNGARVTAVERHPVQM